MFRYKYALYQTWKTVNMYKCIAFCSSIIHSRSFHRTFNSSYFVKFENMKLLAKKLPITYSTSAPKSETTITSDNSEKVHSVDMSVVTKSNIEFFIYKLKTQKGNVKSALDLLKICKDADRINVQLKKKFVKEIWNILAESKQATEEHCEEYLLCNLSFGTMVSPQIFLTDLIKCNIFISYKILKLLLECSCNHGSLTDINFILLTFDEMKFPITKEVQRLLMIGNAKAGKMDEVIKIFRELSSLEGIASQETYVAVLKAAACAGNLEILNNFYKEAMSYEVDITEDDILAILETLIFNNHLDLIPDVLEWKSNFHGEKCKKFLLKLTSHNYGEIAVVLLPVMSDMGKDETFAKTFLKRLVQANVPFNDVLSACTLLTEKKVSENVLLSATHFYLLMKDVDASLKMFQILSDSGFPIRVHYFWPLIITSYKKDNAEGVFQILGEMRKHKIEFDETTLRDYVLPRLKNLDSEIILSKICNITGWRYSDVYASIVAYHIHNKEFYKVYELLAADKNVSQTDAFQNQLAKQLAIHVLNSNIKLLVEIIALMPPSFVSLFVKQFSTVGHLTDISMFVSIIKELNRNDMFISRDDYRLIVEFILKKRNITNDELDEISVNLLTLVRPDAPERLPGNAPDAVYLQTKMGKNEAKEYFENLLLEKERNNEDPSSVLCNLLSIYIQSKDYEKAVKIKNKTEELAMKLTPGIKSKLLQLSLDEKDLQSSILYYKEIATEHPSFEIDSFKVTLLADLLVEKGLADQALDILEVTPKSKRRISEHHRHVQKLLSSLAKLEDVDMYIKFLEALVKINYAVVDAKSFYPQTIWFLEKGKIEEACKLFSYCVKFFKVAPAPGQLISCVIENCGAEELEKILRRYQSVCNKLEVRTTASFAYAQTGRIVELQNFLKENPVTFFQNNIYAKKAVDFHAGKGNSEVLETLFFALYPSEEAEELIPYIFKSYNFNDDKDRPLKFLEKITERNVQFPAKYAKYLASVISLKK